jgi:iron complex outermembrane receptor protein
MMKHCNYIFCFLLISVSSFSQKMVSGLVRDIYTHQSLPLARVSSGNLSATTDEKGKFTIAVAKKALLHIIYPGYVSKAISITDSMDVLIVLLEPGNTDANNIMLQGMATGGNALNTPVACEVVTTADLNRTNGIRLENALNLLPGVRLERKTEGGGSRIVIRGYGNQTNTNGSGYKAYYNGIPITDADGTTILDDVDLGSLGRIEVLKGPASGVYGAGIGGVVSMFAEKAPEGISVTQTAEAGSYGMMRTNTSLGIGSAQSNMHLNYGRQLIDGYRINAASKKDFLTFSGDFYSTEKRTISVFFSYTKQLDLTPGQLNRRLLKESPDTAELALIQNVANTEIENFRTGITHDYRFGDHFSNKTTIFFSGQTIDQPSYTTINKTNKSKFGIRTSFDWEQRIGDEKAVFSIGAEANKNISYQKSYGFTAGVLGTLRTDLEVKPLMYHVFSQFNLYLQEGTLITVGGSINYIEYNIVDDRPAIFGYINTSGYKRFRPLFTPDVSINHYLNKSKTISLYSGYHVGYAPPATSQVIISQTGLVNSAINPEIAESFEIGTKGSLANGNLNYRAAFFNMDVKNKLVTQNFAAANGVVAYTAIVNAGTVNGKGIEFSLDYAYTPKSDFIKLIRPFVSYTYNDFINVDYKSDNNNNSATKNYNGLAVSGLAKNMLNGGVDLEMVSGVYLCLTDMFTGKMPIVYDNSEYADAYNLLNAKIGWHKEIKAAHKNRSCQVDIFAGMDNITNQLYSPMISLNQAYIGTAPGIAGSSQALFFNPAPPKATWYAGCSLRFIW